MKHQKIKEKQMEIKNYCISPEDVYGKECLERHKEELEKWELEFRLPREGEIWAPFGCSSPLAWVKASFNFTVVDGPRLIRIREKAPIRDCYGKPLSALEPPDGYEFTGEFRVPAVGEVFVSGGGGAYGVRAFKQCNHRGPWTAEEFHVTSPRLILRPKTTPHPTLKEVYSAERVTLPIGYEWTGEFRKPRLEDCVLGVCRSVIAKETHPEFSNPAWINQPRLIIRKHNRTSVYFKAEENLRPVKIGEWFLCETVWDQWLGTSPSISSYICATRHEEPDTTRQTVTEEDITRAFAEKEKN